MSKAQEFEVVIAFFKGKTFQKGEIVSAVPKGFEKNFVKVGGGAVKATAPTEPTNPDENSGQDGDQGGDENNGGDDINTVSKNNTVAEIQAYAEGEEIDLGDAKTKAEMLEVIATAKENDGE